MNRTIISYISMIMALAVLTACVVDNANMEVLETIHYTSKTANDAQAQYYNINVLDDTELQNTYRIDMTQNLNPIESSLETNINLEEISSSMSDINLGGGSGRRYVSRHRPNFHSMPYPFVNLVNREEFTAWRNARGYRDDESIAVSFIRHFNISEEDFTRANEELRQIMLGLSFVPNSNAETELYPIDLIFSFDNARISEFFLWENSPDPAERNLWYAQFEPEFPFLIFNMGRGRWHHFTNHHLTHPNGEPITQMEWPSFVIQSSLNYLLDVGHVIFPTIEGYEFIGWYLDANLTMPLSEDFRMPENEDLTIFARWNPLTPLPAINFATEMLENVNTNLVFRRVDVRPTSWIHVTAADVAAGGSSINDLILAPTAVSDATLEVRAMSLAGGSMPIVLELPLPRRVPSITSELVSFDTFTETISVNDTMEHSIGTGHIWTSIDEGVTDIPVTLSFNSITHWLRIRATETSFRSAPFRVTVPSRGNPNFTATFNSELDRIEIRRVSLSSNMGLAREFSIDGGVTWTQFTDFDITREQIGLYPVTVHVRRSACAEMPASISVILDVCAPISTPTNLEIDHINEVVTGVSPRMERSTDGRTWTSITGYELNIASMIPNASAANIILRIRYAGTATSPVSYPIELILTQRPATPVSANVRICGFTESIIVNDTMEHRIGTSGPWTPVPEGAELFPITLGAPGTSSVTHRVRFKGTPTSFPSLALNISVSARRAAPNAIYDSNVDTITGISTAMEFSTDNGETWTRSTGITIPRSTLGHDAVTVHIRTVATANIAVSDVRIIDVPQGPGAAPTSPEIDFIREVVTGVAPGMQSSTNGTTWTDITSTELSVTAIIPTPNQPLVNLQIRYAPTATNAGSYSTVLTITRRTLPPVAASARFDGFTETIILNDMMEHRIGTTDPWTPIDTGVTYLPVDIATAAVTHQVRFKGTTTSFASNAFNITVPARPGAPHSTYNATTDTITNVGTGREFSLDGGISWTRATGTTLTRAHFGQNAITVYIRSIASTTTPISTIRIINVPDGPAAAPEGFAIDYAQEVVTGVAPGMQSSTNGTTWTNITTTELNIATMIPAANVANPVTLRIRIAPTTVNPPSIPAELILTRRPATPVAANARFCGFTESILINTNSAMEHRIGSGNPWTPIGEGVDRVPVTVGSTAAVTHHVRIRSTETSFPSAHFSITVPRRAAMPNATFNANSNTITGVSTTREFSIDGGITWTRVVGTTITRAQMGSATSIFVRIAATATVPASEIRVVTVPAVPLYMPIYIPEEFLPLPEPIPPTVEEIETTPPVEEDVESEVTPPAEEELTVPEPEPAPELELPPPVDEGVESYEPYE